MGDKYDSYLGSKRWSSRKEGYYSAHEKVCSICGSDEGVELHHVKYPKDLVRDSHSHETDFELLPLCRNHHQEVENIKSHFDELRFNLAKDYPSINNRMPFAAEYLIHEYVRSIFNRVQTLRRMDDQINDVISSKEDLEEYFKLFSLKADLPKTPFPIKALLVLIAEQYQVILSGRKGEVVQPLIDYFQQPILLEY